MDIMKYFDLDFQIVKEDSYLAAIIVLIFSILIFKFVSTFVLGFIRKFWESKDGEKSVMIEVLSKPLSYFILLLGINLSWVLVPLSDDIIAKGDKIITTLMVIDVFWVFIRMSNMLRGVLENLGNTSNVKITDGMINVLIRSVKVVIVVIVLMSILQSYGLPVGSFLAGLGLIGVAFSFASQELIKSFFGTILLFYDDTYEKGDYIRIGEFLEGTVVAVEMRSTIVKLKEEEGGGLARISNGAMLDQPIWNNTRKTFKK